MCKVCSKRQTDELSDSGKSWRKSMETINQKEYESWSQKGAIGWIIGRSPFNTHTYLLNYLFTNISLTNCLIEYSHQVNQSNKIL